MDKDMMVRTVLDQMIFGQTQKSTTTGEALGEKEAARDGELVLLRLGPAVGILEKAGKGGLLERLLEVLIPEWWVGRTVEKRGESRRVPSYEFVQDVDILLHVIHLSRLLCLEDREWRWGCPIIDVTPPGLKKATNE